MLSSKDPDPRRNHVEVMEGVQGVLVKGEAQKNPHFLRFSGVFDFLRSACSLGIPHRNTVQFDKNRRFLQIPLLDPLVLTMHLVCTLLI